MKDLDKKIVCDCCGDEIAGFYEDNHDGSYTCLSCLIKMDDGDDINNCNSLKRLTAIAYTLC